MKKSYLVILISLLTISPLSSFGYNKVIQKVGEVVNLRCRSMVNPIGIMSPDFSWQLKDPSIGACQKSYEIQIASSLQKLDNNVADIWKSGIRISSSQLHIIPTKVSFKDGLKYWWRVRVREGKGQLTNWSKPSFFITGLSNSSWKAKWISVDWNSCKSLPYLRKQFTINEKPISAIVYLCALGCGDLFVNGNLNDETRVLDPAQTNYEQYALYTTFDITSKLSKGDNCIGVMIGDGWYHQNKVWGTWAAYGNPKMRLQLQLTYADGHKETIISDETWQWKEGPVTSSNIYAGETYDARKEIDNWCKPGNTFNDWSHAIVANDGLPIYLKPQIMEPIRLLETVTAKHIWKNKQGNWIIDFGVNMAAVPRFNVSLPKGSVIKLKMGEYLSPDSLVDFSTTGVEATGVIQTDEYTCKGRANEVWIPRFTYHGFRYAELSGMTEKPDDSMVQAIVIHSAVPKIGTFSCDNDIINRLHELAMRTFLSNIHGIPTDCPHRERCGWLGDAHTVAPFESTNCDMENFFLKYMDDVNSSGSKEVKNTLFHKLHNSEFYYTDKPVGLSYMIAPGKRQCGVASPDWGTAQVQIPWDIYWYYGNKESLIKSYEYMKIWTNHITKLSENNIVPFGLGDWCPPGGNKYIECPIPFSSTAFHYKDVCLMEKTARLLGKEQDAKYYASLKPKIAKSLIDKYYDSNKKTFGSQTADAMALDFGLVPKGDEASVAASIVRDADERHNGFVHVGIFGLARIGQVLSDNNHGKEACRLFTKEGDNSFEWMWKGADATTLWEILPINEMSKQCGLGSSLNHPMQGGYDTWFYGNIAGISPVDAAYKRIGFKLIDGSNIHQASAEINTPYGKASSSWSDKNQLSWKIVIPANTTGEVMLPTKGQISVNGKPLNSCSYISKMKNGLGYSFPSGIFSIEVK
jgi:alpha-L-rhamnosidase